MRAPPVDGIHGCSHTTGGCDGGQAEYVRVPFADVGPSPIPDGLDEDDPAPPTGFCCWPVTGSTAWRAGSPRRGRPAPTG
ncbi:hypothetical protein GCM10010172_47270 [Paractinoplanes ferrugineus]|uniref:Uncharacterized protein n=1 Tax=Paractinoplanes ferrugineus TaxID=113564 RepID=A0A919J491_9ACTN|nr:hypothetical protein Afe05nite_21510 [Actinoplanes ferrugineus]